MFVPTVRTISESPQLVKCLFDLNNWSGSYIIYVSERAYTRRLK